MTASGRRRISTIRMAARRRSIAKQRAHLLISGRKLTSCHQLASADTDKPSQGDADHGRIHTVHSFRELPMDLHCHPTTIDDIDAVDIARAREYALLATVLGRAPDDGLLRQLAELCA